MFRAVLVAGLIVIALAAVALAPRWMQSKAPEANVPACDLLAGPCSWENREGHWQVTLETLGESGQGTEFLLTVRAPVAPERFVAVLRGESMYMGEYPVPLKAGADGAWSSRFVAPFCTTGSEMQWRIDLQSGQTPVGDLPLKLTFWAR